MTDAPRAWVLNLDAEHELEATGSYTPTDRLRAIVAREAPRLVGTLVAPHDVVVSDPADERARGLEGVCWSPTPRARALLEAVGAVPVAAPDVATLRRVNARPFTLPVRAQLRTSFEKDVATTLDEVHALLARPAADGWLVRRSFGAAGRGRRRIAAGLPATQDSGEHAWLVASLRTGPLVVEPWVRVTREYTRSGWVRPDGSVVISPPCFQATTDAGAWTRTESAAAGEVAREDDVRLEEAAQRAGEALSAAGYFGAFGIDAFRHRDASGTGDVLNPLSEINARYTMDWTTGMTSRPDRQD